MILYGLSWANFARLQRVQSCLWQIVCQLKIRTLITPFIEKVQWLPIKQQILSKHDLLVFKCLFRFPVSSVCIYQFGAISSISVKTKCVGWWEKIQRNETYSGVNFKIEKKKDCSQCAIATSTYCRDYNLQQYQATLK